MAFVFRSPKQSVFDPKKQQQIFNQSSSAFSNQHSQLNGTSFSNSSKQNSCTSQRKIIKGLPSLLGRKQNIIDHESLQKQNKIFADQVNSREKTTKNSKQKENYYFLSKVSRDPYKLAFKQKDVNQAEKNFKSQQINSKIFCKQDIDKCRTYYPHQKNKYFSEMILPPKKDQISDKIVNKNLRDVAYQTSFQFKNSSILSHLHEDSLSKLKVDCVKQCTQQIKRKSSPPKKIQKKLQELEISLYKQQKISTQQSHDKSDSQIYMKTSLSSSKGVLPKKNLEDRRVSQLKKGSIQNSFYKQPTYQDQSQQQEEQYSTPGPGYYQNNINLKEKKSFRSRKQKFAKIFVSPIQRFKSQQVKYHQITYINEDNQRKTKVQNQMFLSKTPKFMQLQKRSSSPPPGTYNVRQSIQYSIVSNLLKNANVPNFSSSLPRFNYSSIKPTPGPGYYNTDVLQKLKNQQSNSQTSYFYKSKVKRCLIPSLNSDKIKEYDVKKAELQLLTGQTSQIHSRQQHFDSSQFFTAPPFLSGVERFNQFFKNQQNYKENSLVKKQKYEKRTNPNNHPFNSTQKRNLVDIVGHGVGVGSYLVQKDGWNKKSYNIFFH